MALPPRRTRWSTAARPGSATEPWASGRRLYLDNLKVLLIVAIIVGHAVASYAPEAWWLYSDVRETTLSAVTEGVLLVVAAPFSLLMIPLLFLVAGLLSPPSLERRGVGAYVHSRLLRLGIPLAAFILLWPLLEYLLFRIVGAETESYWGRLLRTDEPLQSGPVWFVGALLVYSLAYAGWVQLRPDRQTAGPRNVRARHLFLLAAVVTVTTSWSASTSSGPAASRCSRWVSLLHRRGGWRPSPRCCSGRAERWWRRRSAALRSSSRTA